MANTNQEENSGPCYERDSSKNQNLTFLCLEKQQQQNTSDSTILLLSLPSDQQEQVWLVLSTQLVNGGTTGMCWITTILRWCMSCLVCCWRRVVVCTPCAREPNPPVLLVVQK